MRIFYLKIGELILSALITLFSLYGAKISEVIYYKRGISLVFIGFLLITLQKTLSVTGYLDAYLMNVINIIGIGFVLVGITILTWFRKKLGL